VRIVTQETDPDIIPTTKTSRSSEPLTAAGVACGKNSYSVSIIFKGEVVNIQTFGPCIRGVGYVNLEKYLNDQSRPSNLYVFKNLLKSIFNFADFAKASRIFFKMNIS
jgi:hypothetical protein